MTDPLELAPFVTAQLRLIELERQAEIDEAIRLWNELPEAELERRGVTLRRLTVADTDVALGGRAKIVLEPSRGGDLPAHRIAPGDVVALRPSRERGGVERDDEIAGVVSMVRASRIVVVLDDDGEDRELPSLIRLDRVAPDVTFRRLRDALKALRDDARTDAKSLRDVLLGRRAPERGTRPAAEQIVWLDADLDPSQRDAVVFALQSQHVALIHGPPGTGKTTAVVELIRQAVQRGDRVLACAPSNIAVDNLTERLARHGVPLVRLGHPARLLPSVVPLSLDAQVDAASDRRILRDLRQEIATTQRKLARAASRTERRELTIAIRQLRGEVRAHESGTIRAVVDRARVVAATTTGAADANLGDAMFDLVVVDEAAQAIEAACWIALHRGRRAVLAGDHRQLAPTIVSQEAERGGLGRTLFERLAERRDADVTRMLTVQYRMHERIMQWSSDALYDGRLTAAPAVREHLLADLPGVVATPDTSVPFLWIDTAGADCEESVDAADGSKANPGEVELVARHVGNLLDAGVPAEAVAVITPYNAQVQLLREALGGHEGLEIGTVDGFQGREKEAIVLSLVRSNADGEVGFLADARRLNVAITRARRHVALIGDSATLANDAFLCGVVEHAQRHGDYRSAWEYRSG